MRSPTAITCLQPRFPILAVLAAAALLAPLVGAAGGYAIQVGPAVPISQPPEVWVDASAVRLGDGNTFVVYKMLNGSGITLSSLLLDPDGQILRGPEHLVTEPTISLKFSVSPNGPTGAAVAWVAGGTASIRVFDGQTVAPATSAGFSGHQVSECLLSAHANALALACNTFDPLILGDQLQVRLVRLALEGSVIAGPWLVAPGIPDGSIARAVALDDSGNTWVAYQVLTQNATGRRDLLLTALDSAGSVIFAPSKLIDAADGAITVALVPSISLPDAVFAGFLESDAVQANVELHLARFSISSTAPPLPVVLTSQPAAVDTIALVPERRLTGEFLLIEWLEYRDADSDAVTGVRHPRPVFAITNGGLEISLNVTPFAPLPSASAFFVSGGGDIVERDAVASFHRVTVLPPGAQLASDGGPYRWLADPVVIAILVGGIGGISLITLSNLSDRFKWLLLVAVWPLYARFRREQVLLDNMRRGAILQVIHEAPGIRFVDVSRRTGIAPGALRHHLEMLEQYGFISRSSTRNAVRLYPAGKNPIREEPFKTIREQIVAEIRKAPGVSHTELSRRVGVKWATLLYHVEILQEAGLLEVRPAGRKRKYWPADKS